MKCDLTHISKTKKIIYTIAGLLYGLAVLGNAARNDFIMIVGVTLFFLAILFILSLWVK